MLIDNKSSMKDYFDFGKLQLTPGLEVIEMQDFLRLEALPGHLSLPLPDGNIDLAKQPLWDYLEKACYTRLWSPGKTFIAFNISSKSVDKASAMKVIAAEERTNGNSNRWWYDERTSILVDFGTFNATSNETAEGRRALERVNHYKLGVRKLVPYDKELHKHKGND